MAGATRIRQSKQARSSEVYDDARADGSGMESVPSNLEEDLNNLRSQIRQIIGPIGKWYDTPLANLADLSLGGGGGVARYFNQPLTGTIDGTNTVFTTAVKFTRNGLTNEALYWNGVRQLEGAGNDYIATESVASAGYDTLTMAIAPRDGDVYVIDFSPV